MSVPVKNPPKTPPKPPTSATDPTGVTRPETTGAEVRSGTAVADTRSTSKSTGLTYGGGAIGDTQVTLDAEFCCPEYIAELQRRILVKWNRNRPETGSTTVVFQIRKDGTFTPPEIEKSGGSMLDATSKSAFVGLTLPPLPPQYKEDRLTIHLTFPYVRY
jgi:outer membrane biosynthesis protein TonB